MTRKLYFMIALLCALVGTAKAEDGWDIQETSHNDDTNETTFTITRSETGYAQIVLYRTVSLSAYASQHYTATSGSITFGKDDDTKTVTVKELTPTGSFKYQDGKTKRKYRLEVTDQGGFRLDYVDRTMTNGKSFSADKVSKSITNLVTFNISGNYASSVNSSKYVDVNYTPPTSQVETSGTLQGYVLIDDSYDYAQKPATVSTSDLINTTGADATYLNDIGYKIYATVCFTEKERDDGYQYIQIVAGDGSASYDTGYDPDGAVNDPANSVYKACFELSDGSNAEGKQFFPHRYSYANQTAEKSANSSVTEFSQTNGHLWQQKFKSSSYQATNSGSLIFDANVGNITTRFDAGGKDNDTWGYKDLFVRMALVDAYAPSVSAVSVAPGYHAKGNTVYVSVAFNEIVTVDTPPILKTTDDNHWGRLTYVAGSGTNVLTFSTTIPQDATGDLNITGFSGTIKDLAGNSLTGSGITATNLCSVDASYEYTITYDLVEGSVATANPTSYTWETASITLNNPTKTGYTFDGWTGSNGNTPQTTVTIANNSHGDKNYTANWTANTYAVTLDGQSATTPGSASVTATYDAAMPAITLPRKTGYTFDGYYTETNGGGKRYYNASGASARFWDIAEPTTLFAKWRAFTYKLTYDLAGGSVTSTNPENYTIESGDITLVNPTRTGYTFAGWTGTGLAVATQTVKITTGSYGDKSYTATWTPITYTVRFYKNDGGEDYTDQVFTYDVAQNLTANTFTRIGCTFAGWSTTSNGNVEYTDGQSISNLTPDNGATITLYAKWTDFWGIAGGADGTEQHPYTITTTTGLNMLATYVNNSISEFPDTYFKLGDDIAYTHGESDTEENYTAIGNESNAFCGNFDGDGHTISGIRIYRIGGQYQGLFGRVYGATVKNIILNDARITGKNNVGGISGQINGNSTIENCLVINTSIISGAISNGGAVIGLIMDDENEPLINNYYYNCSLTIGGETHTSYIGVRSKDLDGAKGIYRLTLGSGIALAEARTSGIVLNSDITLYADGATIDGNEYYAKGSTVTLTGLDAEHIAGGITYDTDPTINLDVDPSTGQATFTMPAADASITVVKYAYAVSYIDENGDAQTTPEGYPVFYFTGTETTLGASGKTTWYLISGNIEVEDDVRVELAGDVNIILADGCSFNGSTYYSIPFLNGHTFTIYAQSTGDDMGQFTSNFYIGNGNFNIRGGNIYLYCAGSSQPLFEYGSIGITGGRVTLSTEYLFFNNCTVTLGCTVPTDYIFFEEGVTDLNVDVTIKDGQILSDGSHLYSGTLTNAYGNDLYWSELEVYRLRASNTLRTYTGSLLADNDSDKPAGSKNEDIISTLNDGDTHTVALQGRIFYYDSYWNTLCLPFDVDNFSSTPLDYGTVMELDTEDKWRMENGEWIIDNVNGTDQTGLDTDGTLYLFFKNATTIKAGKPYIVKWDPQERYYNPVFAGVTVKSGMNDVVSADGKIQFKGTYEPISFTDTDQSILFMGKENALYYPQSGARIGAFRAYFQLADGAQVKALKMSLEGGDVTDGIRSMDNGRWTMDNWGEGSWYSLDGRKFSGKPTKTGLYIRGGRKVFVRDKQ